MQERDFRFVVRVLWVILFLNLGVAIAKIITGEIIKSASMIADGFHSLTDGSSNIVGLAGIYLATRPKDKSHPYGHKKYETLFGMLIAMLLLVISVRIFSDAISRFMSPTIPQVNILSLCVMILTLIINIFVSRYEYRAGKQVGSDILVSDSMHTRTDIYISISVLISLIAIRLGFPAWIDPVISIIITGFIVYAAYQILKPTSDILVDRAAVDSERIQIIVMEHFKEVKNCHKIRSRGREDDIHIDLHITVEPGMTLEDSHSLAHNIERKIKDDMNHNIQVIIHVEPDEESLS